MKTKSLLSVSLVLVMVQGAIAQTSGGPDAFGYTWKDNADAQGPTYNWIDIKAAGTQITGLGDDNSQGTFNLGWSFRYYWTNYNKITVGSNGWVGFAGSPNNIAAPFPGIPDVKTKNTICPLLADLTFTKTNSSLVPGATAWYWTNNSDSLIVQYDSVPYWVNTPAGFAGRYTFQVILSGADSSITFQYKVAQAGTPAYSATEGSATGICNSTGQIGLQVLPSGTFPTENTSVKFYYPNPVTYQVFDATPAWNQNIHNGGFFVPQGSNVNLVTNIVNAGNQPLSNITVAGEMFDVSITQVWNGSLSVSALAAGENAMLTYPTSYNANAAGTYMFRSATSVSGDMNSANDVTDVEMIVVDTSFTTTTLSYSEASSNSAQSGWGGNGGQGIYIEPPFYPAVITSLDFMVTNSGTSGYHLIEILDDDGNGNSPGTSLYLDSAAASAASIGVYNNIPVTTPVVIISGGVYIGWFENGDSMSAIGTDDMLPLSNRNYEIIGGSWASYRNNSVDDIMIMVNVSKFGTVAITATTDGCPTDNTGSATVTVSGGASPFSFMWNDGQTTATATGLAAGSYTVNITNANGAMITKTVMIYNNTVVSVSATDLVCYGDNDGTAAATIGGTAPYTYIWSNGETTQSITGLTAGVYMVTASNADGCMNAAWDTVSSPAMIVSTFTSQATSCPTCNDGSATAATSGGTSPYTYAWSTTPVQVTATATGLGKGTYTVCVTDSKGCTGCNIATVIYGAGINEIYSGASIVISPNPFTSSAHIKIDFVNTIHHKLLFTMYDIYGREIQSIDLSDRKGATIDFTLNRGYNIPNGLYFYRLMDHSGILSAGKLIVQ